MSAKSVICITLDVIISLKVRFHFADSELLYPRELEVGSYRRPSGDLVDGSVRTLKKLLSRLLVEVNTKIYGYSRWLLNSTK